jgi:hypothetical protein
MAGIPNDINDKAAFPKRETALFLLVSYIRYYQQGVCL